MVVDWGDFLHGGLGGGLDGGIGESVLCDDGLGLSGADDGGGDAAEGDANFAARIHADGAADDADVDGAALADFVPGCFPVGVETDGGDEFVGEESGLAEAGEVVVDGERTFAAGCVGQLDLGIHRHQGDATVAGGGGGAEVAGDGSGVAIGGSADGHEVLWCTAH